MFMVKAIIGALGAAVTSLITAVQEDGAVDLAEGLTAAGAFLAVLAAVYYIPNKPPVEPGGAP